MAQQLITNEIDCSLDLRPLTMETILAQNPAITTHTGSEPPYGYVDWWPTSLYVNNEREPYSDPDVRWALSYFIDREQVIDVALGGAGSTWPLPMPSYPGLQPFIEAVADLLEEYPTLEFNPEKGDGAADGKGWAKNGDGMWAKDGTDARRADIESFAVMADIGPVIAEQLRQQGVDASFAMPPDFFDRFEPGRLQRLPLRPRRQRQRRPLLHAARSTSRRPKRCPAATRSTSRAGTTTSTTRSSTRWPSRSPEDQEALMDQWRRAMEIWLPELPDIPIQEWYHRIPMNTTYWRAGRPGTIPTSTAPSGT